MTNICRHYGVNEENFFNLSRKNNSLKKKIKKINLLLRVLCNENSSKYINNVNVKKSDL